MTDLLNTREISVFVQKTVQEQQFEPFVLGLGSKIHVEDSEANPLTEEDYADIVQQETEMLVTMQENILNERMSSKVLPRRKL